VSKSTVVKMSVVFIGEYIPTVSKETLSRLLVQMVLILRLPGIILVIFVDMLLDLLPIHPKVSPDRTPHVCCYILLKKTVFLEIYPPVNTIFISNELKENEIGFHISYDNFIGLLLLYFSTIKTLLIMFYFNLRQMKPSQIC
jgi:hypothetical protein